MSKFSLANGTGTFQLNIAGKVIDDNDNPIGKWTTDRDNRIVINNNSGTRAIIDVHWQFNDQNQFCLLDSQQNEVFNFCTVPSNRLKCELRETVLKVKPTSNRPFQFSIRGDWHLNENHQLEFNVNGLNSVLDGRLSDRKSRFIYRVTDKQNARINYRLSFAGRWEQFTDDAGTPRLKFTYKKEGDAEGVFDLPAEGKLIIRNGANQFRYVYDKDNKTFGITLLGFLKINENLEITYSIDKQSSKKGEELVAQSTFSIQTAFSGNQFDGNLGLVILKDDNTPGNYELLVTGDYEGFVGATRVMVGFRFSQRRNGRLITRTFGIGGAFRWDNGNVTYAFDVGNDFIELELGVDIKLKNGGDLNSKFALVSADGQVRTITFLFGITF